MVLRRRLHVHVGLHVRRLHVGRAWHGTARLNAAGLRGAGVSHVPRLRLEGRRHATTLSRSVAELVVGRVAHLIVVLVATVRSVAAAATASLGNEASTALVFTRDGVTRFAAEMGAVRLGLTHSIRVRGRGALPHVAL